MELLFDDPYYDSEDWDPDRYPSELATALAEFDPGLRTSKTDVGHAADFPGVLVELLAGLDWSKLIGPAVLGALFLKGKAIQESLDAWISLSKRFFGYIKSLKPTRIDEKAAVLLVLNSLNEAGVTLSQLELSVQVVPLVPGPAGEGVLDKRPDAIYVITADTQDMVRITVMKSDGAELFTRDCPRDWLKFGDI